MTKRSTNKKKPARPQAKTEASFHELLRQGTQALQQGRTAEAIRQLEQAHQADREQPDAALNLGGAYILAKKFRLAVAVLEPLSEREPDNPMVWTNLGAAYLGNPVLAGDEQQQRAIAAFEKALAINPVAPHVAYNLGLIYLDRRENEAALHWFQRALQADPNDRDARRYVEQLTDHV